MRTSIYGLVLAASLAISAGSSNAAEPRTTVDGAPSAEAMTIDLLVVRPVSLVATVLGLAVFIVQAPLSVFHEDGLKTTGRKLVLEPAQFTFARPLGDLD